MEINCSSWRQFVHSVFCKIYSCVQYTLLIIHCTCVYTAHLWLLTLPHPLNVLWSLRLDKRLALPWCFLLPGTFSLAHMWAFIVLKMTWGRTVRALFYSSEEWLVLVLLLRSGIWTFLSHNGWPQGSSLQMNLMQSGNCWPSLEGYLVGLGVVCVPCGFSEAFQWLTVARVCLDCHRVLYPMGLRVII